MRVFKAVVTYCQDSAFNNKEVIITELPNGSLEVLMWDKDYRCTFHHIVSPGGMFEVAFKKELVEAHPVETSKAELIVPELPPHVSLADIIGQPMRSISIEFVQPLENTGSCVDVKIDRDRFTR